jgi:hypothetical protein
MTVTTRQAEHRRGSRPLAILLAAGALCLALQVLVYREKHDAYFHAATKEEPTWVLVDFEEQLYYPMRAFLAGRNPYGGYPEPNSLAGYAPHTLLLHLPFGLVAYPTAAVAYQTVVLLLTIAFAYAVVRFSGSQGGLAATLAVAAALLVSRPGQMNFVNGNETVQVMLGAYVALRYAQTRPLLAGAGLAVALIKPTIGVPLVIFMLLGRGDLRAVVAGSVIAAVLSGITLLVVLPEAGGVAPFIASIRAGIESFRATPETNPLTGWSRVDAIAVAAKLMGRELSPPAELAFSLGILAAGVLGVRRFLGAGGGRDSPVAMTLICLTILIFTYQQAYNVLILALPAAALFVNPDASPAPAYPVLRRLFPLLLLFPFLNYLSTYGALTRLGVAGWQWSLVTSLSGIALLIAWAVTLGGAMRPGESQTRALAGLGA